MEDLLQSQIRHNCRLALPEGLKDLMFDISREVLRYKPDDLYSFIVDYLSALLLVRETLPIACRICRYICKCSCQPELEDELKNIGLEGEDLETVKNVVMEYFDKGEVKEGNLLTKLFQKTSIDEHVLPAIQNAVRVAFLRHQLKHQDNKKLKSDEKNLNEIVDHTIMLHRQKFNVDEIKIKAATRIQAFYRRYVARRQLSTLKSQILKKKNFESVQEDSSSTTESESSNYRRLSSYSLAGSFLSLPQYVPYSAHDIRNNELGRQKHETIDTQDGVYLQKSNVADKKNDKDRNIILKKLEPLDRNASHLAEDDTKHLIEKYINRFDIESPISSDSENKTKMKSNTNKKETVSSHQGHKKHQLESIVNELIEEKQLSSIIYGEQRRRFESIIDEMTEANNIALLSRDERKHEVKIIMDELIDESSVIFKSTHNKHNYKNDDETMCNKMKVNQIYDDKDVEKRKIITKNTDQLNGSFYTNGSKAKYEAITKNRDAYVDNTIKRNKIIEKITDEDINDILEEYNDKLSINEENAQEEELFDLSNYNILEYKASNDSNQSINASRLPQKLQQKWRLTPSRSDTIKEKNLNRSGIMPTLLEKNEEQRLSHTSSIIPTVGSNTSKQKTVGEGLNNALSKTNNIRDTE